MCGFSLILFSSHVTCSLIWEARKSFPFNHTIQESSQAMPRCLLFSMIPAWNSMSPFKLESFFKLWKIFFLVFKLSLLLHLLLFFPARFIIHMLCLLVSFFLGSPFLFSTQFLSSVFVSGFASSLPLGLPVLHSLLQFVLHLKSRFLVEKGFSFASDFLKRLYGFLFPVVV